MGLLAQFFMKIPENLYLFSSSGTGGKLVSAWNFAAEQVSLESGIYITIKVKYRARGYIESIVFVLDEREFEGLDDLKKAISLKAFL